MPQLPRTFPNTYLEHAGDAACHFSTVSPRAHKAANSACEESPVTTRHAPSYYLMAFSQLPALQESCRRHQILAPYNQLHTAQGLPGVPADHVCAPLSCAAIVLCIAESSQKRILRYLACRSPGLLARMKSLSGRSQNPFKCANTGKKHAWEEARVATGHGPTSTRDQNFGAVYHGRLHACYQAGLLLPHQDERAHQAQQQLTRTT